MNVQIGWLPLLGVVLVFLKLFGLITISWWWVLAPFIVSLAIVVCVYGLVVMGLIIAFVVAMLSD